jgi:hypothetical protein
MSEDDNGSGRGRSITLGKIVGYLFGILLILGGLGGLIQGPGGVLILLGGIFALPIVRRRITDQTGVSFSRWAVALIVIVLVIAGGAMLPQPDSGTQAETNGGGGDEAGDGSGNGDSAEDSGQQSLSHDVGESFTVGDGDQSVQYQATDAFSQDAVGTSGVGSEADGIYLVVILEMENVGDESFDITDRHLRAVDSEDREFEADFEASAYADSDPRIEAEGITYEQLNPGLSVTRAVIFDVNPGEEYRLKIEPVGVFSSADTHYVTIGSVETE